VRCGGPGKEVWRGLTAFVFALGVWLAFAPAARADAVDDAMARGAAAYQAGDLEAARRAFAEAGALLETPNAVVAYDLGTTYARLGDLGRATYYLTLATDTRTHPTPEIAERARANLAEVRRRAELLAAAEKAQIDRAASWWELLLESARAPWVGWGALLSGVFALLAWFVRARIVRRMRGGVLTAVLVVSVVSYGVLGGLHAMALRADAIAPRGILLGRVVEVRERPSRHAPKAFVAVGGARVRVEETVSGFVRVRLPGSNLEGWVPAGEVGRLDDLSFAARDLGRLAAAHAPSGAPAPAGAPSAP